MLSKPWKTPALRSRSGNRAVPRIPSLVFPTPKTGTLSHTNPYYFMV